MNTGAGGRMRRAAGALLGRRARLPWVHLVLGGALLMPYWLLSVVMLGALDPDQGQLRQTLLQLTALFTSLPMAAATALVPTVRALEGAAARALCGDLARYREGRFPGWMLTGPALGLALLLLIVATSAGCGALLARWAPALLGPTPEERLAAAERRTTVLAQRNRLARELHDSVGHALSAVGIQASAAARVLRTDPDFAAEALQAIERTTRAAVAELDAVLGLLREEEADADRPAGPTLGGLDDLLRQLARTGVTVDAELAPGLARLPAGVSREAYRIVQEGLANVLRYAGPAPAGLRVVLAGGRLEIELTNPLGPARPSRPGGGRGLRGIGERATALRGGSTAGPSEDGTTWRLAVWLPGGGRDTMNEDDHGGSAHGESVHGESRDGARDGIRVVIAAYESGFVLPS